MTYNFFCLSYYRKFEENTYTLLAIDSIIVYQTTIILNILHKVINYVKFKMVKN